MLFEILDVLFSDAVIVLLTFISMIAFVWWPRTAQYWRAAQHYAVNFMSNIRGSDEHFSDVGDRGQQLTPTTLSGVAKAHNADNAYLPDNHTVEVLARLINAGALTQTGAIEVGCNARRSSRKESRYQIIRQQIQAEIVRQNGQQESVVADVLPDGTVIRERPDGSRYVADQRRRA